MADEPKTEGKTFTQDEVDEIVKARLSRLERKYQQMIEDKGDNPGQLQAVRAERDKLQEELETLKSDNAAAAKEKAKADTALKNATEQAKSWRKKFTETKAAAALSAQLDRVGVIPGARDLALAHLLGSVDVEIADNGDITIKTKDGKVADDTFFNGFAANRKDIIAPSTTGGAGSSGSPARQRAAGDEFQKALERAKAPDFNTLPVAEQQKIADTLKRGL